MSAYTRTLCSGSRVASSQLRTLHRRYYACGHRAFATVGPKTILGTPPKVPVPGRPLESGALPNSNPNPTPGSDFQVPEVPPSSSSTDPLVPTSMLNKHIFAALHASGSESSQGRIAADLPTLASQYVDRHGRVLESSLAYESRPGRGRRVLFDQDQDVRLADEGTLNSDLDLDLGRNVVMVVHALQRGGESKVTVCSGFALNVSNGSEENGSREKRTLFLSCAHTFEEIRSSRLAGEILSCAPSSNVDLDHASGSFIVSGPPDNPTLHPISSISSSLHRSDLLLLSTPTARSASPSIQIKSLPVSPYPAHQGTPIRAHFVADKKPPNEDGWKPWVGGTWSKWVRGTVVDYRDFAGREAKPGTYDALSHMLFQPLPTPGSSGGPIVDEESGAVVGVVIGSRMDNRIVGTRGWGVPSETIFEMFSLPGLKLKNKN